MLGYKQQPPTEKQLNFIRAIEDALGYEFDFVNGSRKDATRYISEHIDEYREYREDFEFEFVDDWGLIHGY